MALKAAAALLAAGLGRAAGESYTHFEFQSTGLDESYVVSEGVAKPYTVIKQTLMSKGFPLLPGQMLFTDPSKTHIPMPSGQFAIVTVTGDVVNDDASGNKVPTPLHEVYDHHWIVSDAQHKNQLCPYGPNFVFGIGAESRNTKTAFPKGYGYVVQGFDSWFPWGVNLHLLRTDNGTDLVGDNPAQAVKECNECYYAPNKGAGCSPRNSGSFQCCGDACYNGDCTCPVKAGTQMVPKTYYLRMFLEYTRDLDAISPLNTGVYATPNCAAFYIVEQNDRNPYHLSTTTFDVAADGVMLQAVGHQHVGGVNISFFHNDRFVCASYPRYGKTDGLIGDDRGYLVEMSECFNADRDPTLSFKRGDKVRVDSWYYVGSHDPRIAPFSGGSHLNVMGYMFVSYQVTKQEFLEPVVGPLPTKGCEVAFHRKCGNLLGFTMECLDCVKEHLEALKDADCETSVPESMCQFRLPQGGIAPDVLV